MIAALLQHTNSIPINWKGGIKRFYFSEANTCTIYSLLNIKFFPGMSKTNVSLKASHSMKQGKCKLVLLEVQIWMLYLCVPMHFIGKIQVS